MRLAEAAERSFARHETFHPRYSWFRKAFTHVAEDGAAFNREDATVEIGVGKNMVRAIRFWGLAARLITLDGRSGKRGRTQEYAATRRGAALFGEGRWDPYMEGPRHSVAAALAAARPEVPTAGVVAGVQRVQRGGVLRTRFGSRSVHSSGDGS